MGNHLLLSDSGNLVQILGQSDKAPLRVVKASKPVKGIKQKLPLFLIKLNSQSKILEGEEPKWLNEYEDVFPEKLTKLPPSRGLEHEIELEPGSQPVSQELPTKCLYQRLLN